MKRSTKLLIAATAVSIVTGIAAVSYAAWTAGGAKSVQASGQTGSIVTVGDVTVTPINGGSDITAMDALLPVDQGSGTRYWEFAVKAAAGNKVTIKAELEPGTNGTSVGSAALYYSKNAPNNEAVSGAVLIGNLAENVALPTIDLTNTYADGDAHAGEAKVYVYMTASSTDAMNATIKITFEATVATAT